VTEAEGEPACLVLVWPAREAMPIASAERRRASGPLAQCRQDVVDVVRAGGRPLTSKEVVRALREANRPHGPGTVAKALADLTNPGDLVNARDKRGSRLPNWPRQRTTRACSTELDRPGSQLPEERRAGVPRTGRLTPFPRLGT
jgi:hypothetical protein